MKLQFMGMTMKKNDSHHYGRVLICCDKKNPRGVLKSENSVNCFLYYYGFVHRKFLPLGQMVNQAAYLDVLRCIRDAVGRKQPEV
jgi:hypothetical protein